MVNDRRRVKMLRRPHPPPPLDFGGDGGVGGSSDADAATAATAAAPPVESAARTDETPLASASPWGAVSRRDSSRAMRSASAVHSPQSPSRQRPPDVCHPGGTSMTGAAGPVPPAARAALSAPTPANETEPRGRGAAAAADGGGAFSSAGALAGVQVGFVQLLVGAR